MILLDNQPRKNAMLLLAPARAVRPVDGAVANHAEHVERRAGAVRGGAGQFRMTLLATLVLDIDGIAGLREREGLARLAWLRLAAVVAVQVGCRGLRVRVPNGEAEQRCKCELCRFQSHGPSLSERCA